MIRSSRWQALSVAVGVAALCLAPVTNAERLFWNSETADADQSPAGCRADCAIGKQSMVTLSGVDTTKTGRWVVRDSRGRYVAVSDDFRQLLIFEGTSPRPSVGRIVSLFVDSAGAVHAYDSKAGSLLAFDSSYRVTTRTTLPHPPALSLGEGRFLVEGQIDKPGMVGHPLHVMSKDGSIARSFGADAGPFRPTDTLKNSRAVCLNPDGTIWSIASGGRLLERWDTSTGRRLAQVTVKSTWFRESSTAFNGLAANPFVVAIWAEGDLVWILYKAPDPKWIPRRIPESEWLKATARARAEIDDRRSDWVLEAVRSDTGSVVALRRFDRQLLRQEGSVAITSDVASANPSGGLELWTPTLVKKK